MLVKIEARSLIFPGTDFHFPSTSVPPGTFFLGSGLEHAAGWHWNAGALERLVEDNGNAAASATGRSSYIGNRISFQRRETEADVIAVRVPGLGER